MTNQAPTTERTIIRRAIGEYAGQRDVTYTHVVECEIGQIKNFNDCYDTRLGDQISNQIFIYLGYDNISHDQRVARANSPEHQAKLADLEKRVWADFRAYHEELFTAYSKPVPKCHHSRK